MEDLLVLLLVIVFFCFGSPLVNMLQTGLGLLLDPEKYENEGQEK